MFPTGTFLIDQVDEEETQQMFLAALWLLNCIWYSEVFYLGV